MLDETPLEDQVVVVDYDPAWPAAYAAEKAAICRALDGLAIVDIQHIGSTSIPGLRAKPVIDVLVAVARFGPLEEYGCRLEALGYRYATQPHEDVRLFFRKGMPRTHHLHIVEASWWEYRRLILFRDYLLEHPETAEAYEALKRDLAQRYADNRPMYTESKTGFIEQIIALADAAARSGDQTASGPSSCA
jgi:GrpB-like predicted nucleotidyltransferase (UPF0157 family)